MRVALAMAILVIGGCATKAQHEAARIQGVAATDAPLIDACWRAAVASPPFQALKTRMGEYSDSPTSSMKLNPNKATPLEAAQMLGLRAGYLAPCRRIALEGAGKVAPAIVAVLADNYAKADENFAKFTTYTISWGEFVSANQALVTERRARLLAAGESLQRSLDRPSDTEAAERQGADDALSNWTRKQQILLPNQPVTTCRYAGPDLKCMTD